ncbi:MAG TPA: ATP-binding protein [Mycobacterium sp.]|nr:ATP-binding protein [Mycobacterium sp.]
MFEQPVLPEEAEERPPAKQPKRPSRWSPSNWSVRWKVLAIVVIPLALAVAFGGIRVYNSVTTARDLRHAAERADMIAPIEDYTASLESALLAYSSGSDGPVARKAFDDARVELQRKLSRTDVDPDVRGGVTTLLNAGPALLDKVASNTIGLRDTVTAYAPILLTAEDAIAGSVRVNDEKIRAEAQGLSRAVGARGQMLMQKLLVNRGGEIPEPELRTSMITLAGTEPSTLFGMNQVLGVGSPDAKTLQDQMVARMAIMSDPASVLPGNADILKSLQTTEDIAKKVISDTTSSVTSAVDRKASSARTAAIRDSAIVVTALLIALLLVLLAARSLVRPLRRLREGALRVAHEELPDEIDRINDGEQPGAIQPIPVHTAEEIGQVAHAVDDLHEQALLMAAEQARLQAYVSDMFETMSRRSRTLVDQQLSLIDDLERNEDDPRRLEALFKLDHLAARMRRTGTNLLVLAGSKVRRDQTEPMTAATVISAAASQVEDYQRVVTATVADNSVVGSAAGDIVHLLAELIDNALRYSPPSSQVRVSAVHTGNRGLVIEVSDAGLGMTEADLRMANMRLESGGEVTPYSTRHMGLFVVGRLAQQHGLVVRLRSSLAGEPRSGTTAGVFIPSELLERPGEPTRRPRDDVGRATAEVPAEPAAFGGHAASATLLSDAGMMGQPYRNGSSGLPQRDPGTSGIVASDEAPIPSEPVEPADEEPADEPVESPAEAPAQRRGPADTSAFFSSRQQATEGAPVEQKPARTRPPSSPLGDTDVIFQRMVSEWLVDPQEIMPPMQSWESVWDSGWTAAEQAEDAPVEQHTDQGLPVREPGARLVPGSPESRRPNGAHRRADDDVADEPVMHRDPEAVRASLSSHWGGVRAGRSHAREDGPENE